jgi:hypothetical protein
MVEVAKIGRMTAHAAGPLARLAETRRRHASAISAWQPSSLPAWLNEETYTKKVQPLLKNIANPVIMSALGVSVTYAVAIRTGRRRPHPRHWQALAKLAGVSADALQTGPTPPAIYCQDISKNLVSPSALLK